VHSGTEYVLVRGGDVLLGTKDWGYVTAWWRHPICCACATADGAQSLQ
jgi:hypothetical protein